MAKLPSKVVGVYWTGWSGGTGIAALPRQYNLIYPFAAHVSGTQGAVAWSYAALKTADLAAARAAGKLIILSCGGAGSGINFSSRTVSQNFVNSIDKIRAAVGGNIDGIDLNTFEANATRNTQEYIWIGQELKRKYGQDFIISSPPAPWNQTDRAFCKALLAAGAMDYCAPQYYDGPGLADPAYIIKSVGEWVRDVAGGDASKIVVGFGRGGTNYSTVAQIQQAWTQILKNHPNIKGAFLWQHATDQGWEFASKIGPLINPSGSVSTPTTPPVVSPTIPTPQPTNPTNPTTPTVPGAAGAVSVVQVSASHPVTGLNVARGANELVVYTAASGSRTPTNRWGAEAVWQDGKITAINDRVRETSDTTGTPIPASGAVISGHDAAREWILANLKVGTTVVLPNGAVQIQAQA